VLRIALVVALVLSSACARAPSPVRPDDSGTVDVLIDGGTVVTMDPDRRVLEGGALALRGNRIVAVLEAGTARPAARERIDARGQLVIPGLVNTHGHVPMTLLRGLADDMPVMTWLTGFIFPIEAREVNPDFVYEGTRLGCLEMLLSGTTTYTDMYYFEDEVARATSDVGMRGVLGQTVIGFPAPDYKTPDESLAAAERLIQKWKGHALVVPSVAPHALYTTPVDVVRRAHALARRYGVPLQIHAAEIADEDERVLKSAGQRSIPALAGAGVLGPGTILHHAIWLREDDLAVLARSGASTSHNPESNMKTAAGVAPVPELLAAGVAVGLGTDGPASNNNLDMFEAMDFAAKLHKSARVDATALPGAPCSRWPRSAAHVRSAWPTGSARSRPASWPTWC
jgi:5-methylthioadenosine/S-adenosylhomocysteine deaminase